MISTTTNRRVYQGDGSSAVFNFQYEFHAQSDLDVYTWNSARVIATSTKVLNVDYTISGVADAQQRYTNGANVIFNSSPATGDYIIIVRDPSPTNPFNLQFNQVIPNAELSKALDRLTIIEQRLSEYIGRGLRLNDAFPLAFNATLPERMPAGAPLIIGSGGVTIETGVVALIGTTAATYFGVLPVNNGGTGLDMSTLVGIPVSPGNNTTFDRIQYGPEGYVLTSHGSSAPTFDAFAVNLINSGILDVSFGGTGMGTSYIQYGVMFGSSTTQMANTAAGGNDVPLIGNGAVAPSFRALNVASASSVTNIMRQINGGTGTASSFTAMSVIYQNGPNSYGAVAPTSDGFVLRTHGSSAPSFDFIPSSPTTPTTVAANTILTNTLNRVILNSSNYSVQLFDAVGNGGAEVEFIKITNPFNANRVDAPIIITGSGNQGVGLIGSTFPIYTKGETVRFVSDNVGWIQTNHYADTDWIGVNSGPISIRCSSATQPNKDFNTKVDRFDWRREGRNMRGRFQFRNIAVASSVAGVGDYIFDAVPLGIQIDTSVVTPYTVGEVGPGAFISSNTVGPAGAGISTTTAGAGNVVVYSETSVRLFLVSDLNVGATGGSYLPVNDVTCWFAADFLVPILGWRP